MSNERIRTELNDDALEQVSGGCLGSPKSLAETRTAAVTMLNAGADRTADQGMCQAQNAARYGEQGSVPSVAFGGSSMRATTG